MQLNNRVFWCILLTGILFLTGSVQGAAINTINSGNTVFLGEQGLDITAAMGPDSRIGWWASGADIQSSSPTNTIETGSQKTSFTVSPSAFSGYLGTWYRLDANGKPNGSALIVADPTIALRLEDTTVGVDVTDKWVPTGDSIRFRIDSNLVAMSSQRGDSAKITIKVQPPGGGIFTALVDSSGNTNSIVDIPLTTSPQSTNSIWDTGKRENYPPGAYTIWAECNTNKMKDNYEQTGKTITQKISLLDQDQNPLIGAKTTTIPTSVSPVTTIVTSRPTTIPTTPLPTPTISSTKTILPTTIVTSYPATVEPTNSPLPPATTLPVPTKTPGFQSVFTCVAILLGIAVLSCSRR